MATRKKAAKNAPGNAVKDAAEPGASARRVLVPVAVAALAALGPAAALGGKAIRDRREQRSRTPSLAVVPVVGGLLAVLGAVAWRYRERVLELAGNARATAAAMAGDLTGRLKGAVDPGELTESDASSETFSLPVTQGASAA